MNNFLLKISDFLNADIIIFFSVGIIFWLIKYLLDKDIENKRLKKEKESEQKKKRYILTTFMGIVFFSYILSVYFHLNFLTDIVRFSFAIAFIYLLTLFIHRKILVLYGEEVEVSGQTYFKRGYTANIFSLFINVISFVITIFLCIQIFALNTFIEIGGLWAGILAFMGFTAPVWAIDMIAGIILLHSKTIEVGNVIYIYETSLYAWIKNISLTEVKLIDLRTGNPIVLRSSQFRNMTLKNLSQGISGKTHSLIREIDIHISYRENKESVEKLCYEAFDEMIENIKKTLNNNYFGEEPYRNLEISDFSNDAVSYKFFYTITSPFYIFKAERLLNEYLLANQRKYSIYFATPKLVHLEK